MVEPAVIPKKKGDKPTSSDSDSTPTKTKPKPKVKTNDKTTPKDAPAPSGNTFLGTIKAKLKRLFRARNRWAVIPALFAALTVTEVSNRKWYHEEHGTFSQSKEELFNYVTYLQDVPEWFPLVYGIAELDKKPLMVGKEYTATANCFYGTCTLPLKVTQVIRGTKVELQVDSWLKPVVSLNVGWGIKGRSKLTMGVYFNRTSLAFQYTAAPLLKFMSMQHIKHSLFQLNWLLPFDSTPKAPMA